MKTLREKMIVLIAVPVLVIFLMILGGTWIFLNRQARSQIQNEMAYLANIYADKFNDLLIRAAEIADSTASFMETNRQVSEQQIFEMLSNNVNRNPVIYGSCMAFEPGTFKKDDSLYAPYVYRTDDGLKQMNITRDVYDWYSDPKWEWFQQPKKRGAGYWSRPYFDKGAGNVLMATYSAPFFYDGQFTGVVTVDLHLSRLKQSIGDEALQNLRFDVFTTNGEYVYSDVTDRIMNKTLAEIIAEYNRPDLEPLVAAITSGQSGMTIMKGILTPETYWVFYSPIPAANWCFTCRISEREALAPLRERMAVSTSALGLTLLAIVGCIVYMSGKITRPITLLNQKVLQVAEGNLDVQTDEVSSQDEIGTLSRSFNKMTADLRTYVEKVAALTKIEADLAAAREIQQSTLPKKIPDLKGFEIEAWNQPAEETGGDTYDIIGYSYNGTEHPIVITVDNAERAVFLLADATGHGIAPALSVTQLRAMLRMAVHISPDFPVIIKHLNEQLHADLPEGKFITAWLAVVNPQNNTLTYFSAGQGPLIHYNAAAKSMDFYEAQSWPLGITDHIEVTISDPITLHKGDVFAVISDGIFEAENTQGELLGNERVENILLETAHLTARQILDTLRQKADDFIGGGPPHDDQTIIIIKKI